MKLTKDCFLGIILTVGLAIVAQTISKFIPYHLISAGVFALILGMLLNPIVTKNNSYDSGIKFTSKKILKLAIILMGATLSISQVVEVGRFSLIVMVFTLLTAFGGGYLVGKIFNMDWKLSSLISAGTGICGGSAIAAIAPVIEADDSDIAYAISATFLFDIIMVVLFPLMGQFFNMTDLGYGLWAGTAVNDTSSVVAAGYAFSDIAGRYSVIVKLTRTLSIVPIVVIFSYINNYIGRKTLVTPEGFEENVSSNKHIDVKKIFPWFIIMFLGVVVIKSTGIITDSMSVSISSLSKFLMIMSLGAIGLKTNFSKLAKSGFKPMLHGFIISLLVVVVSFIMQMLLGIS